MILALPVDWTNRYLRKAPRLRTGVVAARNWFYRPSPWGIAGTAGGLLIWTSFGFALAFCKPEALTASLAWLFKHRWHLAGPVAVLTAVLGARRRARAEAEAARSWLAAVPVSRAWARTEALLIQARPMAGVVAVLTLASTTTGVLSAVRTAIPVGHLASTWSMLVAGSFVGGIVSFLVPLPQPVVLPPGSRYVPYRSAARGARLAPSIAALGLWPIRKMFASLRPQAVARVALPILMIMPLDTQADAAMLAIGLCTVVGAMLLLLVAMAEVVAAARRWLQPLPIGSSALVRQVLARPLLMLIGGVVTIVWLWWLMQPAGANRP